MLSLERAVVHSLFECSWAGRQQVLLATEYQSPSIPMTDYGKTSSRFVERYG